MVTLSSDTITSFALCDAGLLGLSWIEEGRDLQLQLELADDRRARLTCVWISGLKINLEYEPPKAGIALSWECRFEQQGRQWHMAFEFPPEGRIELDCNEARIEYENAT